jgi:hypothetical protein
MLRRATILVVVFAAALVGASVQGSVALAGDAGDRQRAQTLCLASEEDFTVRNQTLEVRKQEGSGIVARNQEITTTPYASQDAFQYDTGYLYAAELCSNPNLFGEGTAKVVLEDVRMRDMRIRGPVTHVSFDRGRSERLVVYVTFETARKMLPDVLF